MQNLSTPFDNFASKKIVGVDFDEVITDNKAGWIEVLALFKRIGYDVIIVTYRSPQTDPFELDFLTNLGYPVYFTNHIAKKYFLEEKGIHVDIWIDDYPLSILQSNA